MHSIFDNGYREPEECCQRKQFRGSTKCYAYYFVNHKCVLRLGQTRSAKLSTVEGQTEPTVDGQTGRIYRSGGHIARGRV